MIPVTKTFFPPMVDYAQQLERIWHNEWLTNRGELVQELEAKLSDYLELNLSKLLITNNGTIPIQIALKLFGKGGEIITTPFSYVATTAAIVWENCTPVFVDIHPEYLTIDETKIEDAITDRTTCILATHVFGNPCNVEVIEAIARKHDLIVIYDAAHCFGISYLGKSIFEYGDVSTCSFHATKIFHTGEGGALFAKDPEIFKKCFYSHNFGHDGPLSFHGLGINGKISELQAAMGLSVLPYMDDILKSRKATVDYYDENINFGCLRKLKLRENVKWNYSYYPVVFKSESDLLTTQSEFNREGFFPRRYFYPSLNRIPYTNLTEMKVSENVASCILCLPLYANMDVSKVIEIVNILNNGR